MDPATALTSTCDVTDVLGQKRYPSASPVRKSPSVGGSAPVSPRRDVDPVRRGFREENELPMLPGSLRKFVDWATG